MNRNIVNFCVLVALSVLGVPNVVHSKDLTGFSPTQKLVKLNQTAGKGLCLPKSSPSILGGLGVEAFEAQNLGNNSSKKSSLNKNDPRLNSLSNVIGAISRASNGRLNNIIKGTKFFFGRPGVKNNPRSRQAVYGIQLNPGGQNVTGGGTGSLGGTDNMALIAHEFGHKVGNTSGNYNAYKAHMRGTSCTISHYGHTHSGSPNEHFADVFAAYVTNPGLFHNKGSGCAKSFEFFKNMFGEPNLKPRCDSRKGSFRGGSGGSSFGKGSSGSGGLFSSVLEKLKNRKEKVKEARKKRVQTEAQRNQSLIRSAGGVLDSSDSP